MGGLGGGGNTYNPKTPKNSSHYMICTHKHTHTGVHSEELGFEQNMYMCTCVCVCVRLCMYACTYVQFLF